MANLKEIQRFIKEMSKTDLYKIEIKTKELELFVQLKPDAVEQNQPTYVQQSPQIVQAAPAQTISTPANTDNTKETTSEKQTFIKSPIVGTFYAKPSPDKPNFVSIGDDITVGQTVCIVEAMKLFNEIESEVSGKIAKILVEDGTPVEFDQPLFLLK